MAKAKKDKADKVDRTYVSFDLSSTTAIPVVEFASGYSIAGKELPTSKSKRRPKVIVKTVVKEPPTPLEVTIGELPAHMRNPVRAILKDPGLAEGVREMFGRSGMTPMAALLSGLWLVPEARRIVDDHLDKTWAAGVMPRDRFDEVVVGAGLQAAIYCAVRVSLGFPRPLVLERSDRVGGVFAVSRGPSFFLNSRNRPGTLSVPGQMDGSLNFIPNGPVQPSHLSGDEFQTNDAMAWAIRLSLAMNARVVTGAKVTRAVSAQPRSVRDYNKREAQLIVADRNGYVLAGRAILAEGLSVPRDSTGLLNRSDRVMTFEQFMGRMDSPFPLRDMDRVAVLGGGDGGKTAIEALTGKGPGRSMSVAALDWPRKISWFGAPQTDRATWQACNRSRYLQIGSLLPDNRYPDAVARVEPKGTRATVYAMGYECVYLDDVPYDYVIDCTGYSGDSVVTSLAAEYTAGERSLALTDAQSLFRVGVAARLPLTAGEETLLRGIQENSTSAFRYAPRTAMLAATLATP